MGRRLNGRGRGLRGGIDKIVTALVLLSHTGGHGWLVRVRVCAKSERRERTAVGGVARRLLERSDAGSTGWG